MCSKIVPGLPDAWVIHGDEDSPVNPVPRWVQIKKVFKKYSMHIKISALWAVTEGKLI